MGLSNELSCEAGSFTHNSQHPQVFSVIGFKALYSTCWSPGLRSLSRSSVVSPSLYTQKCGIAHSTIHHLARPSSRCLAASPLCPCCPSPPLLPVFNSLVVGLPYSSIFWQFWFFVFKLVVVLLVVQGSEVFLPTSASWPELLKSVFLKLVHT